MVGPVSAITYGFQRAFIWRGYASRSEFWFFLLFALLCQYPIVFLQDELSAPAFAALDIVLLVPLLAVTMRRLHDSDLHGAWIWTILVPAIGWLLLLALCTRPSTPNNR